MCMEQEGGIEGTTSPRPGVCVCVAHRVELWVELCGTPGRSPVHGVMMMREHCWLAVRKCDFTIVGGSDDEAAGVSPAGMGGAG